MKLLLKKLNKNAFHFIKCENNDKKIVKLGSYSKYQGDVYVRLNFRKFYYFIKGGGKFYLNRTYLNKLGDFNLLKALYLYETKKYSKKSDFSKKD